MFSSITEWLSTLRLFLSKYFLKWFISKSVIECSVKCFRSFNIILNINLSFKYLSFESIEFENKYFVFIFKKYIRSKNNIYNSKHKIEYSCHPNKKKSCKKPTKERNSNKSVTFSSDGDVSKQSTMASFPRLKIHFYLILPTAKSLQTAEATLLSFTPFLHWNHKGYILPKDDSRIRECGTGQCAKALICSRYLPVAEPLLSALCVVYSLCALYAHSGSSNFSKMSRNGGKIVRKSEPRAFPHGGRETQTTRSFRTMGNRVLLFSFGCYFRTYTCLRCVKSGLVCVKGCSFDSMGGLYVMRIYGKKLLNSDEKMGSHCFFQANNEYTGVTTKCIHTLKNS